MTMCSIVEQIKEDLFLYGEAYFGDVLMSDEDVGITFLMRYIDNDDFCRELLLAILGDKEAAKYIVNTLDKFIQREYDSCCDSQ